MSTAKWILGGLGFVMGGPIGAIIGVVIASLFDSDSALPGPETTDTGYRQGPSQARPRATQGDIRVSLLVLIACVMKADGHVRKSELDLVKRFLTRNYGEQGALSALQVLKHLLEQDINPVDVGYQIAHHVNYSTRLELLHFLFDLANADGEFVDSELQMIQLIAHAMNISDADFRSLAALYQKAKDPDWAYTLLEITPAATNDEVKKAYRRMAMKYHPDKVAGAGDEIKANATEKFRAINEAYEHIKSVRGIN